MKPSYTYARNVIVFLLSAFVVFSLAAFLVKPIRVMFNLPEKQYHLDGANSELVKLLLKPADFPKEFGWYSHWMSGAEYGATSTLDGQYSHQELSIIQSIHLYLEPKVWNEPGGIQLLGQPGTLSGVHDLHNANIVDFQKIECLFNLDDTIICRMDISKSNVVFDVEINYGKPGDIAGMENILNSVLNAIADKVKSI